jgi:hypothetical protein
VKHLEKHLSFANVVACIALFIALGSGAYAATAMLPKKSVKAKHLAQGVVTTTKLRNGAVTAAKLRNGAVIASKIGAGAVGSTQLADGGVRSADLGGGVVTSNKLKDGAVTSGKLGANAVTAGKIADGAVSAGKLSPTFNAQLVKNVSYVTATSASNPNDEPKSVTAECPAGRQVIGGGAKVVGVDAEFVAITETALAPAIAGKRTGWVATAREISAEPDPWAVEAYAVCAEL